MGKITNAGLALIATLQANGQQLTIDKFIFADMAGLDVTATPPGTETVPAAANIVHEQAVTRAGCNGIDTVVYSCLMGSTVGDFYFNWVGLYSTANSTLVAVAYVPRQLKRKTVELSVGNTLTKNFAMQYQNAVSLTGVTIPAETWQVDLTARLGGIDERERRSNYDTYGTKYFFDSAFLVSLNGGTYQAAPGIGYIDGIRCYQDVTLAIGAVATKPANVYLDAALLGDWSGKEATWTAQVSTATLTHYTDAAGQKHWLERIAIINADGSVTDCRGDGTGGMIRNTDQMAKHLAATDPHPQYAFDHEHPYEPVGLVAAHEAKSNPHAQYARIVEDFVASKVINGYTKLANGIILQWGSIVVTPGTDFAITFPIAFPTAPLNCSATAAYNVGAAMTGYVNTSLVSVSAMKVKVNFGSSNAIYWFAIGY